MGKNAKIVSLKFAVIYLLTVVALYKANFLQKGFSLIERVAL
jgi:hypothetical protein